VKKTLQEITEWIGGKLEGDGDRVITGLAGLQDAEKGHLSFVGDDRYASRIRTSEASALIVGLDLKIEGFDLIRVKNPYQAWDRLLEWIKPPPIRFETGVHNGAAVSDQAKLGEGVAVMAHATVEDGAVIGDRTRVYPGVYVGHESRIGADCILYPNAVIRERVVLGDRVILHAGAVIGSDGFGFSGEEGARKKQEQFGTVVVEDDVEIGANVTIDRARFDVTRIGQGAKIDNLVQIAHNVVIGPNSIIISQTGIAGSARIGKNVIMAGQVGVAGHITIGDHVKVAAKAGVTKSVAPNEIIYGNPAGSYTEKKREVVGIRKIPDLLETVKELSERVSRLETQSENDKKSG
jgi:UDP-3-O-[3-hydroxymyristoyl] glucosamine N-acyltransferase